MIAVFDFRTVAWIMFAVVALISATRVRLPACTSISLDMERSIAFGLVGMMFIFAYPDDRRIVAALCFLGVIVTELLQAMFSTRYERMEGVIFKTMGATAGLLIGAAILQIVSMISVAQV